MSKEAAEQAVLAASPKLLVSIFKPSIIIGSPSNPGTDQTINHFALTIARVHKRVEGAREKVQDALALPPLRLGFRVRGNPQSTLNVIPVDLVARAVSMGATEGTFFITNPHPPSIATVAEEIGQALGLNIQVLKEFRASPPENLLEKLIAPFLPYLQGEPHLPTIVNRKFKLSPGYIRDMVSAFKG